MEISLITFSSELNKQNSVYKTHELLLSEIEKNFTLHFIDYNEVDKLNNEDFNLVFIASGGVEKAVIQCYEKLPHPTVLLTDGLQNSLAAALEIATWVRNRGMKFQIIHGDPQSVAMQILAYYNNFKALKSLREKRVGVLGIPSSWLVASNVDYLLTKRRWGTQFIDIPLERVYQNYKQITEEKVEKDASIFAKRALACRDTTPQDLLKAMRLYKAIKQICEEEKLDALTLNCFVLIEKLGTTGCLALSLLNDEGILAGCEGDLQSIFTLLAAHSITGQIGFMANPTLITEKTNEIVLAHCTVSTKLTEQFIIRNHFESQSGIAIQGILPTGDVTLVKCGGECLDEYFVSSGTLIENTNYVNACRTQVRIRLNNQVSYFFRNPLANHHIMLLGNYEKELNSFFQSNSCKRVE